MISAVVPVKDEAESLPSLHVELVAALERIGEPWEIVYVDDGSTDGSLDIIKSLARTIPASAWIASEKAHKSVVPLAFWYFSLVGGSILLAYAIWRPRPSVHRRRSAGARDLHAQPRYPRARGRPRGRQATRKSISRRLTSSGASCWTQWVASSISTSSPRVHSSRLGRASSIPR